MSLKYEPASEPGNAGAGNAGDSSSESMSLKYAPGNASDAEARTGYGTGENRVWNDASSEAVARTGYGTAEALARALAPGFEEEQEILNPKP